MELEKFQFQGTFDNIRFIVPLSTVKSIKIIKINSHQKHEARAGRRRGSTKRMQLWGQENGVWPVHQFFWLRVCIGAVRKMQIFHPKFYQMKEQRLQPPSLAPIWLISKVLEAAALLVLSQLPAPHLLSDKIQYLHFTPLPLDIAVVGIKARDQIT